MSAGKAVKNLSKSRERLGLGRHLLSFGIQQFDSDDYWSWSGKLLGRRRAERLDQLRQPVIDGGTVKQMVAFYDYICQPSIAKVVHSMKADAIRISGDAVDSALPLKGHVLELGCSIGYLTTYYGLRSARRNVTGIDLSAKAISRARLEAAKRKVWNVAFVCGNITEGLPAAKFDAIVSTQVLGTIANRRNALSLVAQALSPGGILVSVEALGNHLVAESYVAEAAECGLRLMEFDFVYFSDLGENGAYPVFKLALEGTAVSLDLSHQYEQVLDRLGLSGAQGENTDR
jgi:2-polyprenyl-3-methyl-5-hydroxy-6-metoxy-1,4-benzoquinol methylase